MTDRLHELGLEFELEMQRGLGSVAVVVGLCCVDGSYGTVLVWSVCFGMVLLWGFFSDLWCVGMLLWMLEVMVSW